MEGCRGCSWPPVFHHGVTMCRQDQLIGMRRWAKITEITGPTEFKANFSRVGIIVAAFVNNAAPGIVNVRFASVNANIGTVVINEGNPMAELWLERHGTIVFQGFFVGAGVNTTVTEIFESALDKDPVSGDPFKGSGK